MKPITEAEFYARARETLRYGARPGKMRSGWQMPFNKRLSPARTRAVAKGEHIMPMFRAGGSESRYNSEGSWALRQQEKPRKFGEQQESMTNVGEWSRRSTCWPRVDGKGLWNNLKG